VEKTVVPGENHRDLPKVTDKLYHIMLYWVHATLLYPLLFFLHACTYVCLQLLIYRNFNVKFLSVIWSFFLKSRWVIFSISTDWLRYWKILVSEVILWRLKPIKTISSILKILTYSTLSLVSQLVQSNSLRY